MSQFTFPRDERQRARLFRELLEEVDRLHNWALKDLVERLQTARYVPPDERTLLAEIAETSRQLARFFDELDQERPRERNTQRGTIRR